MKCYVCGKTMWTFYLPFSRTRKGFIVSHGMSVEVFYHHKCYLQHKEEFEKERVRTLKDFSDEDLSDAGISEEDIKKFKKKKR